MKLLAANEVKCQPMGDFCFHPQLGIVEDTKKKKAKEYKSDYRYLNSHDKDLLKCDKGNHFDLYCGKAEAVKKNPGVELWIDTSSSMNRVDPSPKGEFCERRYLASFMRDKCQDKLGISTFDTGLKLVYDSRTLCISSGTNDGKRLVSWIENSTAKTLVIVTDADEYHGDFREYLDRFSATIYGMGVKHFTNADFKKNYSKIENYCR